MSSTTEFVQDNELDAAVKAIIEGSKNPALNPIRDNELKIVAIMKVRTNKEGEHEPNPGPPAKLVKVPDMWKLFTDAHYLIVVDYYCFHHSNARDAAIFNALCGVEVKAKDGVIKLATKQPEIAVFAATVQEYGAFDEILLGLKEWMVNAKTKAAKSFADKVANGKLEAEEPPTPPEDEDPPRVHAGAPEEQQEAPRRGGRSRR